MSDPINDAIDQVRDSAPIVVAEPPAETNGTAPAAAKILTVEDILTAPDIQEKVVEVPEWGGAVKIKSFTKARQLQLRSQAVDTKGEHASGNHRYQVLFLASV